MYISTKVSKTTWGVFKWISGDVAMLLEKGLSKFQADELAAALNSKDYKTIYKRKEKFPVEEIAAEYEKIKRVNIHQGLKKAHRVIRSKEQFDKLKEAVHWYKQKVDIENIEFKYRLNFGNFLDRYEEFLPENPLFNLDTSHQDMVFGKDVQ